MPRSAIEISHFENLGSVPDRFDQRHMPFPMAHADGTLDKLFDDLSDPNDPWKAADMIMEGRMPPKRGVVELGGGLAGYDLTGSERISEKECVLPPTHKAAVDDESREFRGTGLIPFTTEDGLVKLVGAVVSSKDAETIPKYVRKIYLPSGLVQVVFPFDSIPSQELVSKTGGEMRTKRRHRYF